MSKIAIVTTHPIQYYAPWFKLLNEQNSVDVKVFYTWSQSKESVRDKTFKKNIIWDIPLLEGYSYVFVNNVSSDPGSHHKNGIICPTLIHEIREYQPDAILVFGWYLKSHLDVMKHFKGKIPVWFRGDSNLLDNQSMLKAFLRKVWLRVVYSNVDRAFYVGTANYKYFQRYGLTKDQLTFAPHAIDNTRFGDNSLRHYTAEADAWKAELGLEHGLVILFAGKFEDKKDPILLIETIQYLNNKFNDTLKLILVGDGPLRSKIDELAGEDDNIRILPFQNQSKMPVVYRLGDIFCLPSKGPGETWGLAVNEAMASGKGVIISDKVGCGMDLVKNGENGFVFESGNQSSLSKILSTLNSEQCKNFGTYSEKLIQQWSFEEIVASIHRELVALRTNLYARHEK